MCIAISILVTWNFRKMSKKPVGREEGGEKQTNCNRFDWVSFEAELNLATFASCSLATCFHRKCRRSWSEIRSENKPNWRTYRGELQLCARFNSYEIQKMASASKASKHWNILQKFRFKCRQLDENERFTVILERLI